MCFINNGKQKNDIMYLDPSNELSKEEITFEDVIYFLKLCIARNVRYSITLSTSKPPSLR